MNKKCCYWFITIGHPHTFTGHLNSILPVVCTDFYKMSLFSLLNSDVIRKEYAKCITQKILIFIIIIIYFV